MDLLTQIKQLKKENQKLKKQLREIERIIFGSEQKQPPPESASENKKDLSIIKVDKL
jgi:hypothetical protein